MTILPKYEVQTFERIISEGGRNRPWIVTVQTNDGPDRFVLKLFSKKEKGSHLALNREFYSSVLASEFDLNVPAHAILELSDDFVSTLPPEIAIVFNDRSTKYAFGSRFHEDAISFYKDLDLGKLQKYQIESIFAFDSLILNTDRRNEKPNMLFLENECFLIDHEMAFEIGPPFDCYTRFNKQVFQNHIFYDVLRRVRNKASFEGFETFHEHLRRANFSRLEIVARDLRSLGIFTPEISTIVNYLESLKSQSTRVIQQLITRIS